MPLPLNLFRTSANFSRPAFFLALVCGAACGQARELVSDTAFAKPDAHWRTTGSGQCTMSIVNAITPEGSTRVLSLAPKPKPGDAPWKINVVNDLSGAILAGSKLSISFWARSPDSCTLLAAIQPTPGSDKKTWSKTVELTPEWKLYRFTHVTAIPVEVDQGQLQLTIGYGPGTIELFKASAVIAD